MASGVNAYGFQALHDGPPIQLRFQSGATNRYRDPFHGTDRRSVSVQLHLPRYYLMLLETLLLWWKRTIATTGLKQLNC